MIRRAPAVRPRKRLAALLAALLLTAAFTVHEAAGAPAAATPTTETAALDVSIVPGSVQFDLVVVIVDVAYTCTVPNTTNADLRVTLVQGHNDASEEQQVTCSSSTVDAEQEVAVPLIGANPNAEITATASLTDGAREALSTEILAHDNLFLSTDPTAAFPGNGTITLTGKYRCATAVPVPFKIFVTAEQVDASDNATVGTGLVNVTACDDATHTWTTNITGSITGDAFEPLIGTDGYTNADEPQVAGGDRFNFGDVSNKWGWS